MLRILVKTSVVNIDKKFLHRTKKYATDTLNTTSKRAKFTVKGDKPNDSDRVKKKKKQKKQKKDTYEQKKANKLLMKLDQLMLLPQKNFD